MQASRRTVSQGFGHALGLMLYAGAASAFAIAVPLLLTAALVPGGTWMWPRGLATVGFFALWQFLGTGVMLLINPRSIEVRTQPIIAEEGRGQPWADRVISSVMVAAMLALVAFIPADVFWLKLLPPVPEPVARLGAGLAMAGLAGAYVAVAQNEYAAPNVQDQSARGQRLIDRGLYRLVRHPMYASMITIFAGLALWLGSAAAALASLALVPILLARIDVEERYLKAHLDGYAAYAARARAGGSFPVSTDPGL